MDSIFRLINIKIIRNFFHFINKLPEKFSDCPKKCFARLTGSSTPRTPSQAPRLRLFSSRPYAPWNRSEGDVHATVSRFSCDQLRHSRLVFVINHRIATLQHWIYATVIGFLMAELGAQKRLIITPASRIVV